MKKFLLAIFILSNFYGLAFGALSTNIVWEVRTTGAATNGGGFKAGATGTDFSQQDAAQYSLTGVTTAAADAILLTASAASDMVGNIANITGGTNFITGRYEITDVSAGVSITLDRTCTTAAGALGTVKIGGAVNHPQTIASEVILKNIVFIKSGTYLPLGANDYVLRYNVSGSTANGAVYWIGYNTTHWEETISDANMPVLDANGVTNVINANTKAWNNLSNLKITGASGAGILGKDTSIFNCRIYTNGSHGIDMNNDGQLHLAMSEIYSNSGSGIYYGAYDYGGQSHFLYNYIHDNSSNGLLLQTRSEPTYYFFNIIESNSGAGLNNGQYDNNFYNGEWVIGNIAYNNTSHGISIGANVNAAFLGRIHSITFNNISMSNGIGFLYSGYPNSIPIYGQKPTLFNYNSYYGNTTALSNISGGSNDVTTNPLFTNPANGDFTLQAGSPLIGAGLDLSTYTSLTTDFKVNIGIDQGDHGAHSYGFSN